MPFGVVSRVSRGMSVLDGDEYRQRGRVSFGVNVGHPIVSTPHEGQRHCSSQITLGFLLYNIKILIHKC